MQHKKRWGHKLCVDYPDYMYMYKYKYKCYETDFLYKKIKYYVPYKHIRDQIWVNPPHGINTQSARCMFLKKNCYYTF